MELLFWHKKQYQNFSNEPVSLKHIYFFVLKYKICVYRDHSVNMFFLVSRPSMTAKHLHLDSPRLKMKGGSWSWERWTKKNLLLWKGLVISEIRVWPPLLFTLQKPLESKLLESENSLCLLQKSHSFLFREKLILFPLFYRYIYTLYLMSDSYIGMDQQYDIYLNILPANTSAEVNTEISDAFNDLALK